MTRIVASLLALLTVGVSAGALYSRVPSPAAHAAGQACVRLAEVLSVHLARRGRFGTSATELDVPTSERRSPAACRGLLVQPASPPTAPRRWSRRDAGSA